MRNILTVLVVLTCQAFAADWVVTEGGISPDKKFAVAVIPQKTKWIDEADDSVLLVDQNGGRTLGKLGGVSSSGGTWGTTTTNVRCTWSEDSTLLIVKYRTGRLMQDSQIYRIQDSRAIPLSLPDQKTHPKGAILQNIEYNSNPGSEVSFGKDGTFIEKRWGYRPDFSIDYSKHGLKDFEGDLVFHYRFDEKGNLKLEDIVVPPMVK